MKIKVLKRVSTIINGERVTLNKGDEADITDEKLLNECKEKGLIEIVSTEDLDKSSYMDTNINEEDENIDYLEDDEDVVYYLTPEEISKLKTKDDIIQYGEEIGLEGLNDSYKREELEDMVNAYIENLTGEDENL